MNAYVPAQLQRDLREQCGGCCAYCRSAEDLTAITFEFEHIVPRAKGGATERQNLCLACPMCNRYKSDGVLGFDPETQMQVPLFHPQQDIWTDHFAWNVECSQVVGLTASGRATIVALKMNRPALIRVRRLWVAMEEHPPRFE